MKNVNLLSCVCLMGLIGACSILSPSETYQVQKYKLSMINQRPATALRVHKTLLVSEPTAAAGYQTADMLYIQKPFELSSFIKNEWVAPPASMIFPLIVQSLRNSGRYDAVLSAPFSGHTDFRLDSKLIQMDQNFTTKPSQVSLVLQADLVNNDTNKVIASKRFMARVNAPSDDPYGGVKAMNRAVSRVMQELNQFVAKT